MMGFALLLGLAATGQWLANGFGKSGSNMAAFQWLCACVLALAALLSAPRAPGGSGIRSCRSQQAWFVAVGGLFLLALALRTYQLVEVPYGVWYDEAETGLEARRLLGGSEFEPLSQNFGREPAALFYLVAFSMGLFGDSLFAVRIVTAVIGALAAPATALLGRELFGWRVGLVAGLLMALSRWQLDFSRFGMINVTATLLAPLGLWLLVWAARRGSIFHLGLAGMAAGLGLHSYAGLRPILVVEGLTLALLAVVGRWGLKSALAPVAVWLGVGLLISAPVALFAVQRPDEYTKRLEQTSLLARKETTQEKVEAVIQNTRVHLEMFHYRGDRNGRHNLPGLPMLDPIGGVLLVLGLGWALLHLLDWRYVILLLWGGASLAGGILSLDFEAPQAARTIAIVPALSLLGAIGLVLALDRLRALPRLLAGEWVSFRGQTADRLATWSAAIVGAIAVGWSGWITVDVYFNRQMPGRGSWLEFSPRETIIAREARQERAVYPLALLSATLVNHPTIRFLAPELKGGQEFDPVGNLPVRAESGTLLYLEDRDHALWDEVARFYPDARLRKFAPPSGGEPVLAEFALPSEVIHERMGLAGTYLSTTGELVNRRELTTEVDWREAPPVAVPFQLEWSGGLVAQSTGPYLFRVPPGFELTVDGSTFSATEWPNGVQIHLARGNHRLRLSGEVAEPRAVALTWLTPEGSALRPIPAGNLFHGIQGGNGLLGVFYAGEEWAGAPRQQQIDPNLAVYFQRIPMSRPYSVEWSGYLDVTKAGTYRIGVEQVSTADLWLDEQLVLSSEVRNQYREAAVRLGEGPHSLRVRFRDKDGGSHIYLYWTPPGGKRQIIPGRYLYSPPPIGTSPGSLLPPTWAAPFVPAPRSPAELAAPASDEAVRFTLEGHSNPIGVAVDSRGSLYVADSGNARVVKLAPDGRRLLEWGVRGDGEGTFQEPFDIAVGPADNVYVLDSGRGVVQRFDSEGRYEATLLAEAKMYRPRGLAVDALGRVYVADTGRSRIVMASSTGELLRTWVHLGQRKLDQPTDVAVDDLGNLYVAEPPTKKLTKMNSDGQVLAQIDLSPSDTQHAPHLASLRDGWLAVSDPGASRVLLLGTDLSVMTVLNDPVGELMRPVGVAATASGEVWVVDAVQARILRLRP